MRTKNRRRDVLSLELLENRTLLDAGFGFEVIGPNLYFTVTGSPFDDFITLSQAGAGDYAFSCTYSDANGDTQFMAGTVTAGEIALAQLVTGRPFAGLKADGDAGDDSIIADGLLNAPAVLNGDAGNDFLIGSPLPDVLNGGTGNDIVLGGAGSDIILGSAGNDYLDGEAGADQLAGGTGIDSLIGDIDDTVLMGGTGGETLVGGGDFLMYVVPPNGGATLVNEDIEVVIGTPFGDRIDSDSFVAGGELAGQGAVVFGQAGNDVLTGSPFDDMLFGETGNDLLEGRAGGDSLEGGPGVDTLSYVTSPAGVTVNLSTGVAAGGHAAGDVFNGFENLLGSALADILTGDDEANRIEGRAGNDIVNGLMGNDVLLGEAGNDILDGGIGNDRLTGGAGNDIVNGGVGNDAIVTDYDQGLNLNDQHFGGSGQDTFEFENVMRMMGGIVQLDPARVAAVQVYMDNLDDLGRTDWDASQDAPFAYPAP